MKVALDTSAYSDFMRGDAARVRIARAARAIAMPLIVLGEARQVRHRALHAIDPQGMFIAQFLITPNLFIR